MSSPSAQPGHNSETPASVTLPAPTAWPIVLAFGITLLFTGIITSVSVTILGAVLSVAASFGWYFDLFPREKHVEVPIEEVPVTISSARLKVARLQIAPELPRVLLPLETYPVSAGIKGGLAGSVAMAVLACLYGLLKQHSIWYPINLLAATFYAQSMRFTPDSLYAFHLDSFLLAVLIHLTTSITVGLLYGAMLPMIPRHPIFLGGVVAPVLWSGLLRSILDLINPLLGQRVDWYWFIASQFAFGIVAGLVVVRQQRVPVKQFIPFAVRAGIETPGAMPERRREDRQP
ncbi:MAG TPA: hypothetical protein VEJ47_11700 [Candidatus Eremiobacteraceae bacterium]|nr:hypothetical protein [Candidatus Eremiobacteraceae bacterium]